MWYIALGTVLVIWLVIAGAVNLATAYRYTKASLAGLAGVFVCSAALSQWLARLSLPASSGLARVVVGVVITIPVFILGGTLLVEVWRRFQGGKPDIRQRDTWRDRETECLGTLAEVERELEQLSARQREIEQENRENLDRQWRLRAAVENWEQGGGVARIRATKVQQWKEELAVLSEEGLAAREKALAAEIAVASDPVRREQLEIQKSLSELERLTRVLAQPNRSLDELKHRQASAIARKESLRQELVRIRQEAQEGRRRPGSGRR